MRKLFGYLGVAIIICEIIAAVIAYFVVSVDPHTGMTFDGFGRQLSESPILMRLIFGQDRLWPGWKWFVLDLIIFWGGIVSGINVAKFGFQSKDDK
jgi:hypothetical protein